MRGRADRSNYDLNFSLVERRRTGFRFVPPKVTAAERFKGRKDGSPSFGSYDVQEAFNRT